MTRGVDVPHYGGATGVARVVDNDVAEAEEALRNTRGNSHVLHLAQRNVAGGAGDQTGVDLQLSVGDRVTHHVSTHVVVAGNQRSEERRVGKECRSRWWHDH